ncbi:branched-chain amino acid ABC transporter permease [Myceligenerans pegani]|uniref:Branched-chain amino acid ABC transporter permease n=1 Tax=Myceligenerans pegani TaxID=2776917 RepID=A0ABR9N059_9MICO|nr:branched-chain amino acid ABC transporter permease [Myceligenerans sp. TRM 65318]MBE1877040.1 branched-chain amino acid ABC transporter permease [Myceligenerans sp. TRM 65318]MBE3019311.1 branched-chain amino acid ABC transporter permease [Myceligenerans sp. TRM 65318]
MTADRPMIATAPRRVLAVIMAAFAALIAGAAMFAVPAGAATDDIATDCTPDASTTCVSPIVLDEEREPVAGVEVTIAGEGFEAVVTTTGEGPVSVAVPTRGTYTLTVNTDTLPADTHADPTEREVRAQTGATARGAFTIGTGPAPDPEATEPETSAPAEDDAPGAAGAEGLVEEDVTVSGLPSFGQVWQQVGSGLRFGLLLALASVGLSLIFGTTGISSFSHGEQVVIGAMGGFLLINQAGLPVWVAALLIVVIGGLTGLAQDAAIWRPLRRRGTPAAQLMLVTIGLSLALQYVLQWIEAGSMRIITTNPVPTTIAGITLSRASWVSMAVALVVIIAIALLLTKTRIGRAIRAVADNRALASATGIDPDAVVRIVWVSATALAALAGLLIGISFGSFTWNLGVQLLLLMFAAVTLGGLGTAYGALVGSILIGLVVELAGLVIPSDVRYATALLILILVLLIRPQGILGSRERIG